MRSCVRWVSSFALVIGCGNGGSDPPGSTDGASSAGTGDDGGSADDGDGDGDGATVADGTAGDDDGGDPSARPNWHEDIAPLVAANCAGCHFEGGIAFAMTDYATTMPYAAVMSGMTAAGLMPPWHAVETDECDPPFAFKHDARLTPEEIQLIADWAELGAPEGDPANAVAIPPAPSLDLADPTVTVPMGGAITVEQVGDTLDFFHCLTFDPGNTEDVFLDGLQVVPGNDAIVHHVLLFVDANAESAGWPNGMSPDCGGGSGIGGGALVGGWAPGSLPVETPEGVGVMLPAGARIIFNMHYHAKVTEAHTDDATAVALRWTTTVPAWVSAFNLIGAPGGGTSMTGGFTIPAGATGHEEVIEYTVPDLGGEIRLWSVVNHMHKVGVDMKTSLIRGGTGEETCLVQTPAWDFDWQRLYTYDAPIDQVVEVFPGDTIKVRCTYDNTLDNPSVVEALNEVGLDQPQEVQLGEGTLDEMCLAGIGGALRIQ